MTGPQFENKFSPKFKKSTTREIRENFSTRNKQKFFHSQKFAKKSYGEIFEISSQSIHYTLTQKRCTHNHLGSTALKHARIGISREKFDYHNQQTKLFMPWWAATQLDDNGMVRFKIVGKGRNCSRGALKAKKAKRNLRNSTAHS